ncbi:dihydroorotate dehydrogenase electron transfer subunit [Candidatus Palauibacter sp.]|uniref:iron-sulfur cluster-binding protein n=1 Tax=Candidatus Palauibacter sp. TaxID=3101350 RepID=UPI003B51AD5B
MLTAGGVIAERAAPVSRRATLLSTSFVARDTWWQEFDCPDIAAAAQPGQFVMLGVGLGEPGAWLLPRPFSVGWTGPDGEVGILLRAYGQGTRALAKLEAGQTALLLGPLGRPFDTEGADIECIAGGVGLAPFIFLAAQEAAAGRRVRLIYGERDAGAVFDPALIARLTEHDPEVYTEDGSAGRKGLVTAGLDPSGDALLLGCGPTPLLRALSAFAREHGRRLQVSVEEHMGCGIGTCQGCVVRGADGRWVKACVEGSVFPAEELDWGAI